MKKGIDQTIAWALALLLGMVFYGGGTFAFMKLGGGSNHDEHAESHGAAHGSGDKEMSAKSHNKIKADDVEEHGSGAHQAPTEEHHESKKEEGHGSQAAEAGKEQHGAKAHGAKEEHGGSDSPH